MRKQDVAVLKLAREVIAEIDEREHLDELAEVVLALDRVLQHEKLYGEEAK